MTTKDGETRYRQFQQILLAGVEERIVIVCIVLSAILPHAIWAAARLRGELSAHTSVSSAARSETADSFGWRVALRRLPAQNRKAPHEGD